MFSNGLAAVSNEKDKIDFPIDSTEIKFKNLSFS